jgi:hypothetical protein
MDPTELQAIVSLMERRDRALTILQGMREQMTILEPQECEDEDVYDIGGASLRYDVATALLNARVNMNLEDLVRMAQKGMALQKSQCREDLLSSQ